MKQIKEYLCDDKKPTDDEINNGVMIANSENCVVKLTWFVPYSGHYRLYITPGMSIEECREKLPRRYPL